MRCSKERQTRQDEPLKIFFKINSQLNLFFASYFFQCFHIFIHFLKIQKTQKGKKKSILKSHNSLGNLENINSQREGIHHHFQHSSYRFNEFNFHHCSVKRRRKWRRKNDEIKKKLLRDKKQKEKFLCELSANKIKSEFKKLKRKGQKLVELTFFHSSRF